MSTTMKRGSRNLMLLALVSVMLMGLGAPAYASDGQVLGGDGDMTSNVTKSGNNAKVTFDASSVLNDCPTGLNTCVMEYRWRSKKNCGLCIWSADTLWTVLPTATTTKTHCYATGDYRFEFQVRLRWTATTTKTVDIRGKYETEIQIDTGAIVSKLIPAGVFNVTNGYGWSGGYHIETTTGTTRTTGPYTLATSGSTYIGTSCN